MTVGVGVECRPALYTLIVRCVMLYLPLLYCIYLLHLDWIFEFCACSPW